MDIFSPRSSFRAQIPFLNNQHKMAMFQLDQTSLTLSRKTGIFDQRDKPKYVTCLAYASNGDVITGDSNGTVFIWGKGYNAVTKVIRKVHDGPIFSICVLKDGSIITGGGRDSRVVKFDTLYR